MTSEEQRLAISKRVFNDITQQHFAMIERDRKDYDDLTGRVVQAVAVSRALKEVQKWLTTPGSEALASLAFKQRYEKSAMEMVGIEFGDFRTMVRRGGFTSPEFNKTHKKEVSKALLFMDKHGSNMPPETQKLFQEILENGRKSITSYLK